jgi:hypothetical protein
MSDDGEAKKEVNNYGICVNMLFSEHMLII